MAGNGPLVALVGRPNVGKSRLFNALAGKRIAIVHDQPGVTRDMNITALDHGIQLADTGGIGLVSDGRESILTDAVETQVFIAVAEAALILFVTDGKDGITPMDEWIAERLRPEAHRVQLIVNKLDREEEMDAAANFARLGLGEPIAVSAEHRLGVDELLKEIRQRVPKAEKAETNDAPRRIGICFVGRPNVGKSSLGNRLLKTDRLVVSEIPGTTRDAVELDLDYQQSEGKVWPFRLTDTAGLRRKSRIDSSVEFFSTLRSREAMQKADVVYQVIDAHDGVTTMDKTIAGEVIEAGRALIIVVNKWDLAQEPFKRGGIEGYESEREFREAFEKAIRKELFILPDSPIIFVSALEGYAIDRMLKAARLLDQRMDRKLSTSQLNQLLQNCFEKRPPPQTRGKRFKLYYTVQTGNRPFLFRLYCNRPGLLGPDYRRYLEKHIVTTFELGGCPLKLDLIGKERRYANAQPHED